MPRAVQTLFLPYLVLLAWTSQSIAAEPQVEFSVEDGWIQLYIHNDGKPVGKATLAVYDALNPYAEGETADDGKTSFPPPRQGRCWLKVKIDKKEYDAIPLTVTKDSVAPQRILLSLYGRACCRAPAVRRGSSSLAGSPGEHTPKGWSSDWLLASLAGSGCVAAAGCVLVFFRRGPAPQQPGSETLPAQHDESFSTPEINPTTP